MGDICRLGKDDLDDLLVKNMKSISSIFIIMRLLLTMKESLELSLCNNFMKVSFEAPPPPKKKAQISGHRICGLISGKRSYPYVKKSFKTVRQNSNRSGNFCCNWTSFHRGKKGKLKMTKCAETRNQRLFWGLNIIKNFPFKLI